MRDPQLQRIINDIIRAEVGNPRPGDDPGGYTNDPRDPGGETRWGVTKAVAREAGYRGDMRELPRETAEAIFEQKFFYRPKFDQVFDVFPELGAKMMDIGVNMGPSIAVRFLQRALNGLNTAQTLYADVKIDGAMGGQTRGALEAYLKHRGADGRRVLWSLIDGQQKVRYLELGESNPNLQAFQYGWQLNRTRQV